MTFIKKIKRGDKTYLAEVKSIREGNKVRHKFIKYLGREINKKPVKRIASDKIQLLNVKKSLDILCIDNVAKELELNKLIKNKNILALVYSQLFERKPIYKLEEWFKHTDIPDILDIELSTKKLYDSLRNFEEENFEIIEEELFVKFESIKKETTAAVIDVTDTYFEGKSADSKTKKGKDGKVKKLVQIGLATTFEQGFPIFQRTYQSNVSNTHVLKDMALGLQKQNILPTIMDRGMTSAENIKVTKKLGIPIIAGIRKSKKLVKDYIFELQREKIYNSENRIKLKDTSVFIKSFDYLDGKLIVVYNPNLEIIKKEKNFEKEKDVTKDMGYSLIYHDTSFSEKDVVKKYYEKDIIEKAFKKLKGILSLRPIRVWLKEHVRSHIKICYLAYAILSLIDYKLKKLKITSIEALQSLEHGYRVRLFDKSNNHQWDLYVPLQPMQKEILKQLGVVNNF